jgi:hypothetical protein
MPSATYPLPVVTCANATEFYPVILLKETQSNESGSIYLRGSCVVLEGNALEFILLKDRLMYLLAGVVQ